MRWGLDRSGVSCLQKSNQYSFCDPPLLADAHGGELAVVHELVKFVLADEKDLLHLAGGQDIGVVV